MIEYNKAIAELRKKISTQNAEIKETKFKIGKEIAVLEPDKVKDTPLIENFDKVRELEKEIPVKKNTIQEIKTIDNKLEGLQKKITGFKAQVSEKEKIFKSIYENIGNAAYTAFKLNREKLKSYEHIFTDLVKQDARCEQFNKVDISGNSDEKSIIRQFVDAAKSMYRNQKHKFILLRYPGLYRQAGKAILTTDFVEDAADGALDKAMKSLIENEKTVNQMNNDIKELEKNKTGLQEKLVSLDVKGKPYKKIHELEGEMTQIDKILKDCYVNMGNIFLDQNLTEVIGNPRIEGYARTVSDLKQKNDVCEAEIKRYETLIAIEKIDHKMVKVSNKIEHIKNQVAKQEQEIKSLQKELTRFEKQKKTFKKLLEKTPGQGDAVIPETE